MAVNPFLAQRAAAGYLIHRGGGSYEQVLVDPADGLGLVQVGHESAGPPQSPRTRMLLGVSCLSFDTSISPNREIFWPNGTACLPRPPRFAARRPRTAVVSAPARWHRGG